MKIQSSSPQTRNFDIKGQDGVYDLQRIYLQVFQRADTQQEAFEQNIQDMQVHHLIFRY